MCLSGSLVKFVWIFTSLTSSDKVLSFIFLPRYFRTVTFQWVICTMYMLGLTEDLQFSFQSVLISHPFSRRRLESIETSQPLFLANFEWFLSGDCLGLLGSYLIRYGAVSLETTLGTQRCAHKIHF